MTNVGIFEVFLSHLLKHSVSASLVFPAHWTKLSLTPPDTHTHTHAQTHKVLLECCIAHLGYKCIKKWAENYLTRELDGIKTI